MTIYQTYNRRKRDVSVFLAMCVVGGTVSLFVPSKGQQAAGATSAPAQFAEKPQPPLPTTSPTPTTTSSKETLRGSEAQQKPADLI